MFLEWSVQTGLTVFENGDNGLKDTTIVSLLFTQVKNSYTMSSNNNNNTNNTNNNNNNRSNALS